MSMSIPVVLIIYQSGFDSGPRSPAVIVFHI